MPLDHPVVDVVVAPLPPPVYRDDGADDGDGDEDPGEHGHHDNEDAQRDAVPVIIAVGATCRKYNADMVMLARLRESHAGSRNMAKVFLVIFV